MRCQNSDLVVAKLCMCPMRGQTNTLTSCALLNALGSIQGSGTTSLSPTATSTGTVIAAASSATAPGARSEEHPSELQSLMRTSYAVFCLKKKHTITPTTLPTPD